MELAFVTNGITTRTPICETLSAINIFLLKKRRAAAIQARRTGEGVVAAYKAQAH